jgi:S1-C subfamily serine protease
MSNITLAAYSDALAELTAGAAASVVQVFGRRRPASGVAHGADTVVTTARAIGREDGLRVRVDGKDPIDADLAGWDPASGIAVLRTREPLGAVPPPIADAEPRVGQIVVAVGRSWSNAVSASAGNVAVVGGPLRTGRRREIARVIRVTADMHDGFAGGGLFDASGRLAGITTASAIRGFTVAIPAAIAWAAAAEILTSGMRHRGFLGVAVQPVDLPDGQKPDGRARGLIVLGITAGGPAAAAGFVVGDVLLDFDGSPTAAAEDLHELLAAAGAGKTVTVRVLRGGDPRELQVTIGDRR